MALTQQQIEEHKRLSAARIAANGSAAPGSLNEALDPEPITVGAFTLVEMTAAHRLLLDRIRSPYMTHARELAAARIEKREPRPTAFTDEQIYETLFVLTRPAREARAILAKGHDAFTEAALAAIADVLAPTDEPKVTDAIVRAFERAYATAVNLVAVEGGDAGGNFTTQPPSTERSTASDGSSTSSPSAPAISTADSGSTGSGTT